MSAMASQITGFTIVYSSVYSGADQRKHQSSASLAFVRGIHRWPVNSPRKGPVTRKMFPFDHVIMFTLATGRCFTTLGEFEKWDFAVSYFRGWNNINHAVANVVSEIRWRLRIYDDAIYIANPSTWTHHSRIYNITKAHFGELWWTNAVKHAQVLWK